MATRIALLLSISWIIRLTEPFFTVWGHEFSGRDLTLLAGGLFLLGKSTYEIHESLEGDDGQKSTKANTTFVSVILQILALDVVFSLDSVITAVGMVEQVWVMIAAIVIAVGVMLLSAEKISGFVEERPLVFCDGVFSVCGADKSAGSTSNTAFSEEGIQSIDALVNVGAPMAH